MTRRRSSTLFDQKAIRSWTLYVISFTDNHYYVGITSYTDFMHRIRQHGARSGAKVNQNKTIKEIVEIHPLGRITGLEASHIENDMMLEYRKKFGARKVRGGYDIYKSTPIVPTYTPGSTQSYVFIISCLLIAMLLLLLIATR